MMAVGEDRWKERGGAYSFSYMGMGKERDEDRGDARIEVVHMHS